MAAVKVRITVLLLLVGLAGMMPRVSAQSNDVLTDQTVERCSLAQGYLKDIQKPRDLRTRVDRLQAYRYIANRLDIFVTRLERHRQPGASQLRISHKNLMLDIDNFKSQYEEYDQARDEVINVKNCRNNITKFQTALDAARLKRQEVNASVNAVQNALDPIIKTQLSDVYNQLQTAGNAAGVDND